MFIVYLLILYKKYCYGFSEVPLHLIGAKYYYPLVKSDTLMMCPATRGYCRKLKIQFKRHCKICKTVTVLDQRS